MTAKIRILIAAGLGIMAAVRYFRRPQLAEDRPAMIVRGGSLIFQSGDERTGQKGKPWREVGRRQWTPHQPQGKPARHMVLTVAEEDGCKVDRQAVTDIKIRYVGTGGLERFEITTADGHGRVRVPLVVGDDLSGDDGTSEYPTIERPGARKNFSLSYKTAGGETSECDEVTRAKIEFFDRYQYWGER